MLPRRAALALPIAACGGAAPPAGPPSALSAESAIIAAEAWHTDLCLPAAALREGPLSPVLAEAPGAVGLALGFGLEAWMRADRPGSAEALGALAGGPAVVSFRILWAATPPGAEESVALRLPAGGTAAILGFVAGQIEGPPPAAPPSGRWLLVPSRLPYTLGFTCNTWVMRALGAAGLPVPVSGIRFRGEAMAAIRAEAARQGTIRAAG